jgi:hypothetical protein
LDQQQRYAGKLVTWAKDGFVPVGPARAQRQARAWYDRDLTAG